MTTQSVTQEYLMGIREGREILRNNVLSHDDMLAMLDTLNRTIKMFAASSPAGQMLRGERECNLDGQCQPCMRAT